jgi:P2-related tail formation protein
MSLYDLLPPNATQLERDFSRATSSLERTGSAVPTVRTAKRVNIPDSVVPWLIYEYGLGELLPYLGNDQRRAIAEGVLWQRVRGTPQALKTALNWISLAATIEESEAGTLRWAEYQLGLDQVPIGLDGITSMVGIATISQPVRSKLFRVYAGYDERRFILDDHKLGEGLLCDHSGVYLRPDWPQLSFGREFESELDQRDQFIAVRGNERARGMLGPYEDKFILSHSLVDEWWHLSDFGSSVRSRLIFISYGPLPSAGTTWEQGTWESVLGWAITNSTVPPRKFAKAGIYLSDYAVLSDTNTCFPARIETEVGDGPFILSEPLATGEGQLSGHRSQLQYQEVLERLERSLQATTAAPAAPQVASSLQRQTSRELPYDDNFILSQHRLDEWWHLADEMLIDRLITATAPGAAHPAIGWENISWEAAINWGVAIESQHQTIN